jgi:hypothetical protein
LNGVCGFDGRREATRRNRIERENEHPTNSEVFVFTIDPIALVGLLRRPARRTAAVPV